MNKAQREILRKTRVLEHAVEIRQHAKDLPAATSASRGRRFLCSTRSYLSQYLPLVFLNSST